MLGFHPLASAALAAQLASASASHPLTAEVSVDLSTVAALRSTTAMQASSSALSVLTDAALLRAPATQAEATVSIAGQASRPSLSQPQLAAPAAVSVSAGWIPTLPLPRELSATPAVEVFVAPVYSVPLSRALSAAATATASASAHIASTPGFTAFSSTALASSLASLQRAPAFTSTDGAAVFSSGAYLGLAVGLASAANAALNGTALKVGLERQLSANPLISFYVSAGRPAILSHALGAYSLATFEASGATPTLLPHVPLPPLEGFTVAQVVFPGRLVVRGSEFSYRPMSAPEVVVADGVPVSISRELPGVVGSAPSSSVDVSVARTAVTTWPQEESTDV